MLDAFLEVVHGRTKQAEAEERTRALLSRLPAAELRKIASMGQAVPVSTKEGSDGCWLDKFRGSPLLDQAIGIEKEELEIQMAENTRRAAQREVTQQYGDWDTDQAKRDEISIKRRLLELELAGADVSDEMGGQEGEDAIPPGAAEPLPDTSMDTSGAPAGAIPQPTVENAPPSPDTPEDKPSAGPPHEDGPPASLSQGEEKPKAEKPKTTKITTVEKPTEDKERVDIKAASARMRFSLAVKQASFLDGKAGGVGRVGQLLTGSRKKLLEEASGHAKTMFGPNGQHLSDELGRDAVREGRKVLATRVGVGAAGAGAVAAGAKAIKDRKKEAQLTNRARPFQSVKVANAAAIGSAALAGGLGTAGYFRGKHMAREEEDPSVPLNVAGSLLFPPMLPYAVGKFVGHGVQKDRMADAKEGKTASVSSERELQIKEAFGAAMLQGLKGMGQFAVGAGKMVGGAAKAGGLKAGMSAAGQAGRLGMQQAGNFIRQNPGASAALVAAPAAAVGYAAGRQ